MAVEDLVLKTTMLSYILSFTTEQIEQHSFLTPMNRRHWVANAEKVETITRTSCVLHNYLRTQYTSRHVYTPPLGNMDSEDPLTHQLRLGEW